MVVAATAQVAGQHTWAGLLSDEYHVAQPLRALQREFTRHAYVKLPGLVSRAALPALQTELQRVEQEATARNFQMEGYDTPRVLSTMGGEKLQRLSPMLGALYQTAELRHLIEAVVGGPVYDCANQNEGLVANFERSVGATHGWHVDDVPYTLVVHVEAPPAEAGGLVEFVPQWHAICAQLGVSPELNVRPTVDECRRRGLVHTEHHAARDAYLLRADQCLHRVTELTKEDAHRAVLVFAFESSPTAGTGAAAPNVYGDA
jgi:hypothetical protein